MNTLDDNLITLINAHEIVGYKEIYQRYYKALVMHAEGIVGDVLIAEDVVENVVVALFHSNKTFDDIKSFESYLYRAVHNMALNELKHNTIIRNYEQNTIIHNNEAQEEYDEEYELKIVQLMKYVDELPKRMREVINKSMQGMTAKQIAEHLNISVETVKTHKKRALKMLRESFDAHK